MCLNSTWLAQRETPGQVLCHAKLLLASTMLISKAVYLAQINLRGEFAFGRTPSYAPILCVITLGQPKDWGKEKEVWCLLNGFLGRPLPQRFTYTFSALSHNHPMRWSCEPHFTDGETREKGAVHLVHVHRAGKCQSLDLNPLCQNVKSVFFWPGHSALGYPHHRHHVSHCTYIQETYIYKISHPFLPVAYTKPIFGPWEISGRLRITKQSAKGEWGHYQSTADASPRSANVITSDLDR